MQVPFFSLKSLLRQAHLPSTGSATLRPRDLASLYQLHPLYAKGFKGQGVRIGFIEFARPNANDDQVFWSQESLDPALNTPVTCTDIDRSASDAQALTETDLDIQYVGALAPGASLQAYVIADNGSVEQFMGQMFDALGAAIQDGMDIISISLGTGESDIARAGAIQSSAQSWPGYETFLSDLDGFIQSHPLRVFAAAGDSGAYGGLPFGDGRPQPIWPAIQTSIVAVGGTQLVQPGDLSSGEQAWGGQTLDALLPYYNASNTLPNASGGGGMSGLVTKPAYQSQWGWPGRVTPDIAMFSGPLKIIYRGKPLSIWGTSAAAPIAAAVSALLFQATGHLPTHADFYAHARPVSPGNNWNNQLALMELDTVYTSGTGFSWCTGQGTIAAGAWLP